MQFSDVLTQLNTLPDTYLRPGSTFAAIQGAKAAALFRFTNAADGTTAQASSFSNATGVWLDVWGKLFGLFRNEGESDGTYSNRITATMVSGRATPAAIVLYVQLANGYAASVVEDFGNTSWSLHLAQPVSNAQFNQLLQNLIYVRPAGVPVSAQAETKGGTYMGTINYHAAARVTGAYLKTPLQQQTITLSAYTNNAVPLLPTTFLSDPTINPGLA